MKVLKRIIVAFPRLSFAIIAILPVPVAGSLAPTIMAIERNFLSHEWGPLIFDICATVFCSYQLWLLVTNEAYKECTRVTFKVISDLVCPDIHLMHEYSYRFSAAEPPHLAECLVGLFANTRYRSGILGDLEDHFRRDLAAGMSLARAKRRYWAAALNSIGPQFLAWIKRIGVVGLVADYLHRKLGGA